MVTKHSSAGRVMWAGEHYRWFDCHPPGTWVNKSICTKHFSCPPTIPHRHTNTDSLPFSPLYGSVCQQQVIVIYLFLQWCICMHYQRSFSLAVVWNGPAHLHVVLQKPQIMKGNTQVGCWCHFKMIKKFAHKGKYTIKTWQDAAHSFFNHIAAQTATAPGD